MVSGPNVAQMVQKWFNFKSVKPNCQKCIKQNNDNHSMVKKNKTTHSLKTNVYNTNKV